MEIVLPYTKQKTPSNVLSFHNHLVRLSTTTMLAKCHIPFLWNFCQPKNKDAT